MVDPVIPVVETKLHAPRRRRGVVRRPRLRDRLDQREQPALTLVSAPAGFGKTTLVAELFTGGSATAWVSLDRRDNEPVQFWTYVIAALQTAVPDAGANAQGLLQAPQSTMDAVVATLINDLRAVDDDLVLVLDDYHLIESPEIHEALWFLIEHLPPHIHLVLASRADPPMPLASLRARGELLEYRAADLRFTAAEAAAYLNDEMGLAVTPADIEVLEARTEGWIAALQLAALSMQGRDDIAAFIAGFAGDDRFILDYLIGEVLERQGDEVRSFLLETSVLHALTGSLCDAVTGGSAGRATLERLDRSNLFVVPLDDRRTWYRYHHLFADVLRARLLDEAPARIPELHRRASDWYASNGDQPEAIEHALAGESFDRAAELIELAVPALMQARQEKTFRRWLEALPDELFPDRPVLTMNLVGARMSTGDSDAVESLLQLVESRLERPTPPPIVFDDAQLAQIPGQVAMYRAALALLAGDIDGAIAHANRVLDLAAHADHLLQGAATTLLGLAYWTTGDLEAARRQYSDAVRIFVAGGYLPDVLGVSLGLADIQIAEGRLEDATRTFTAGLGHAATSPGMRGTADMHVGLSEVLIERNDLEAAARHLQASTELGEHAGLPQNAYRWRVATARLRHAHGDLEGALELLEETEPLYNTDYSPPVRPVSALKTRVQVALGDIDSGDRWAADRGLTRDDELSYLREFEHITLARVLLARPVDRPPVEAVIGFLDRLYVAAVAGRRTGSVIEILVLLALARHAGNDRSGASEALEEALTLAQPEGHVRPFLDGGPTIATLLGSVSGSGVAADHARRVLAATETGERVAPSRTGLVDELSARELDVLRLLRTDLSGPDIASELIVSLNTVRSHTKSIYSKLGVNNRREAVRRAEELGL